MTTRLMPISIPDDADAPAAEAYVRAVNQAIRLHASHPDAGPLVAAVTSAREAAARSGLPASACDVIDLQVQAWWEALAKAGMQAWEGRRAMH